MQQLLTVLAGLVMAQGAFAATYTGDGYTVAFDHPGLTFDGTYLTKTYGYSGSYPKGFGSLQIDAFLVNVTPDPGEEIVSWELSINGSFNGSYIGDSQNRYGVFSVSISDSASGQAGFYKYYSDTLPPANGAFSVTTSMPGNLISSPDVNFFVGFYAGGYQSNIDFTIDSISIRFITTVPEPSTYAMLGIGFGMLGFAASRRRKTLN